MVLSQPHLVLPLLNSHGVDNKRYDGGLYDVENLQILIWGGGLMAITKHYDRANEDRCGAAIEALDAAGKTSSAES